MDQALGNFQDDFAQFRARGAIGGISLTVVPPHPEFGDWVEVRSHGLAAGRIVASDGRHWPVEQGAGYASASRPPCLGRFATQPAR